MKQLPVRQVHLDFHTSPYIPGVGEQFDKAQFQQALKAGHVQSVTVFAKCHHGYCYYPTQVGTPHPGMAPGRDLTGELMDACHEIGVRAPVYLPLSWSALDAQEHPEWVMRHPDGSMINRNCDLSQPPEAPRPEVSWMDLCTAGGYRQYLLALTEEICLRHPRLDGLFFDIAFVGGSCRCEACRAGMLAQGLDPEQDADALAYFEQQKHVTLGALVNLLHRYHPDASVFFNTGGADILRPQWHYLNTHYEMEDLPTVWGGYDKLPMRACYFDGHGKPLLGMTGKFHRGWGEFGGYKDPEALRFECASILAYGACISVGDQMHPSGILDMETYRNIGHAFSYAEAIEPYCIGTQQTATLGVFISPDKVVNEGITKLLLDSGLDFGVVRDPEDLARFDTVILPDRCPLEGNMAQAMQTYPGKVMLLGGSGLCKGGNTFAFDVPFTYEGRSEYDMDFFRVRAEGIVSSPILCYTSAHRITGGEALSQVYEPYFSRTYGKYCSHFNTPYRPDPAPYPGAALSGNYLYVAHELAGLYAKYGVTYHRRYFLWLLRKLYSAEWVMADLPSQGRIHLVHRPEARQYVLHLMYASPIQRGGVTVLEDFPTLYRVPVTLRVPEAITSAILIPQNSALSLTRDETGTHLTVPELTAHQMIVFSY